MVRAREKLVTEEESDGLQSLGNASKSEADFKQLVQVGDSSCALSFHGSDVPWQRQSLEAERGCHS